ncbi:hypothetical protein KL938_004716 [Ogataea parapolymorpha]|nr:hypothetical protein KL938_004716 [Ogataea parapolymorpha]
MNVFNAIHSSTSNLISKTGNTGSNGTQPPQLLYFCIIDPSLGDPSKEDDQQLINQILVYLNFEGRDVFETEKAKRIGFIQGLGAFAGRFHNSGDGSLNYIDTDKSRVVTGIFEEKYHFFCGFRFAKAGQSYVRRGLATPTYLLKEFQYGYNLYRINYGPIDRNAKTRLEDWWRIWLTQKFEYPSGFGLTDRGVLNLFSGYRRSSVELPLGFKDNLKNALKQFSSKNSSLVDLLIVNTNWTPTKNFGVIYLNEESAIPREWLINLVNHFERLDLSTGLSTYSLRLSNIPSLKTYYAAIQASSGGNRTLLDRSILQPAIYIHEQLTTHVFNPFTSAINTVASVPQLVSSIGLFGLGLSSNEESEVIDEAVAEAPQSQESLGTELTGKYLLGETIDGRITKTVHLGDFIVEMVVYEINGILFTLLFKEIGQEPDFFASLQSQLDEIYSSYFNDVVATQLRSMEKDLKENSEFFYLIYNPLTKEIKTSLPNIPDSDDIKEIKTSVLPSEGVNRTQIINLTLSLMTHILENHEFLGLEAVEKLVKINRNWWCLHKMVDGKSVIALKKFSPSEFNLEADNLVASFGTEFSKWFNESIESGFI